MGILHIHGVSEKGWPLSVKVKVLGTLVALSSAIVHGPVPPEGVMFWL